MTVVYSGAQVDDRERRRRLYDGDVFVYAVTPASQALIEHASELIAAAFGDLNPELAQFELPVEEFAAILAELKPRFIHHPTSKELIRILLAEFGCSTDSTYFDVPRLRTSTFDGYLDSGISYSFHPHRDTWYSAPFSQLNWWIPIFPVVADNVMAFHPQYWGRAVSNSSRKYNYYEWNRTSRQTAAQHINSDSREQPKPQEALTLDPQIRVVPEAGGVMLFSGQQLHSTVPNTSGRTRFSIDFRTVDIDDIAGRIGATNVDSECTGTSLRDFLRARDFEPIPEELALGYEGVR